MLRYKLRTLLIVLALGPPVLAVAWERRIQILNNPFDISFYIPETLTTVAKTRIRQQFAITNAIHSIAGFSTLLLYPTAVFLQAKVFSEWRDWRSPPRQTPFVWASVVAALLVGTCVVVFFLTLPMRPRLYATDFISPQLYLDWLHNPKVP